MELSISLPDEDLLILDSYAKAFGLASRSAAVHSAIQLLRWPGLEQQYADAWDEWQRSDDEAVWAVTLADGIS